jgi:hypothetical protein
MQRHEVFEEQYDYSQPSHISHYSPEDDEMTCILSTDNINGALLMTPEFNHSKKNTQESRSNENCSQGLSDPSEDHEQMMIVKTKIRQEELSPIEEEETEDFLANAYQEMNIERMKNNGTEEQSTEFRKEILIGLKKYFAPADEKQRDSSMEKEK